MTHYIALFEDGGDDGFGVVFPDLPGCISAGDDYEDALKNAHEALALYADGNEDEMPKPRTLEEIKAGWEDWREWERDCGIIASPIALLPLRSRPKRFNVIMDEGLVARIDRVARNRSEFLSEAARQMLG